MFLFSKKNTFERIMNHAIKLRLEWGNSSVPLKDKLIVKYPNLTLLQLNNILTECDLIIELGMQIGQQELDGTLIRQESKKKIKEKFTYLTNNTIDYLLYNANYMLTR